jgi:hypothetical protein
MGPFPGMNHLAESGVASPMRTKPVGVLAQLDVVVRLKQQADDFLRQFVRPRRQAEGATISIFLGYVDPLLLGSIDTVHDGWRR